MSQMPVKFRVIQAIYENEELSNQEILEILKKEYPHDRSVSEKGVENCLFSLKASGMIELSHVTSDNKGKLKLSYKITDYGARRMNYII